MASLPYTLDEMSAEHIKGLVASEATESATLEFKSEPYAPDHEGSREFLKDVTALANTAGGLIMIGVKEHEGVAFSLKPVKLADADKIKQRLESLLQTAVEPRLFGVRIRVIPVDSDCVLAVHVTRSHAPPHRVTAKGSNRFYLRSSAGAYEASMDELRNLFLQTAAVRDRVIAFRDQRLGALATDLGCTRLAPGDDRFVLHILPMSAFSVAPIIDLVAASKMVGAFRPLRASGWNNCFNAYGHLNARPGPQCHGYTQLFREGMVEAVDTGIAGENKSKPSIFAPHIAGFLLDYVPIYIDGLAAVGAAPPFFVAASLPGVAGATVLFGWSRFGEPQPLVGDLLLPVCVIEDFGSQKDYVAALKPALDALWNAGDLPEWTPEG